MSYQLALFLAGFIYIVTPGPVFLAIISLVSKRGKAFGFKFVSGAIFGCMMWLVLTCASIIEADKLPHVLFTALAVLCAGYLFYLGAKMIMSSVKEKKDLVFNKPFRDGLMLASLNPKSYPVMASVFTGVSIQYSELMTWSQFWEVFVFGVLGFASGYSFMVMMADIKPIKTFYVRHIRYASIVFGLVFWGFAISLLYGVF